MFCVCDEYKADIEYITNLDLNWLELKNCTILITGASGMIGTVIIDVLMYLNLYKKYNVKILALSRNKKRMIERFADYEGDSHLVFYQSDVGIEIPELPSVDYIIHAASNTHPKLYAQDPVGSITTNILGIYHLLEFAKNKPVKKFLCVSSVEVYGKALVADDIFDESYCGYIDCNSLRAGYPESKRLSESLCQAYKEQYGIDFVTCRLSRVYGPTMRMDDSKAMSQFIINAVQKKDIVLKSEGNQRYSYIHVIDCVSAICYLLLKGISGNTYNVAADEIPESLKNIARFLAEEVGVDVVFDIPDSIEKKGYSSADIAVLSTEKIKKLGWNNKYNIYAGLRATLRCLKINKRN